MSGRIRLSGVVIGQDNEASIGAVLGQLGQVCDEVVFVDGGSQDATCRVAAEVDRVRVLERPFDDFRTQKNYAFDQARGEWILHLDTDELFNEQALRWIPRLVRVPFANWYSFPRMWLLDGEDGPLYLADEPYFRDRQVRLFRNRPDMRFTEEGGVVHERLPTKGRGWGRPLRGARIFHYTFLLQDEDEQRAKAERYAELGPDKAELNTIYLPDENDVPRRPVREPVPDILQRAPVSS